MSLSICVGQLSRRSTVALPLRIMVIKPNYIFRFYLHFYDKIKMELNENDEKPIYVFQLPAKLISEISCLLDSGGCWEIIASIMPDIQYIDIEACRRLTNGDGHPTETLLRIWGSKGYTILDLFKIFFRAKLLRCMQILIPFVDVKFHKYAQICVDESDHQLLHLQPQQSPRTVRNLNLSKPLHQSISKKNSIGVYSRKGFTSAGLDGAGLPIASDQSTPISNTPNNVNNFDQNGAILSGLQNTLAVKYEDIMAATSGFCAGNILGKGGYGVVFQGIWKHTEVAIKRIQGKREGGGEDRQQKERIRQSLQELRTLAKFRHDNILSLYGYSLDGPEPCLIYQFMSNGSLEDRLLCKNGTEPLTWGRKLAICKGISCGLHFLHSIGTMPIIHGDVKSANILLDKHFEPKLGDFGLSRDGQIEGESGDKRPMIASHVKGTLAYLPPEFTTSRILTTKLDVFSFGVVLLEMGTGQRAFTSSRDPQNLVDYTQKHYPQNNTVTDINILADKRTPNLVENRQIFEKLLSIGLSCTQKNRFSRPTFSEIFAQLN